MNRILIVDDDVYIGDMLEEVLVKEGYQVLRAYSGTEALFVLQQSTPDLVLLDLMLPGLSGEEVLPHLKGIPVIVLSAKVDISHKVELLLGGAVDYLTKPFNSEELLARIQVHLRDRLYSKSASVLVFHDLEMDTRTHKVCVGETEVNLTRTEYALFKLFLKNPTQVLTKSLLLDGISEDTPDCTESSLKMHISNLRKKLRDTGGKEYIDTVWGIGFKMTDL